MLKKLHFTNFRGFSEHTIPFQPFTLVIGQNNAGKSTIVEALRLVALVIQRLRSVQFTPAPSWLTLPRITRGVSPSLANMEIDLKTANYRYGDPPAIIKAGFENGVSITIYVGTESIYAIAYDSSNRMIKTKGAALAADLPDVEILPQVAPLLKSERILNPDYVKRTMSSALAPLHFRNQLHIQYSLFPRLQKAVEETWDGLRVLSLEGRDEWPSENILSLFIQDEDFSAEASWMGHGLQMWLQTMWFLVRAENATTVILDAHYGDKSLRQDSKESLAGCSDSARIAVRR